MIDQNWYASLQCPNPPVRRPAPPPEYLTTPRFLLGLGAICFLPVSMLITADYRLGSVATFAWGLWLGANFKRLVNGLRAGRL